MSSFRLSIATPDGSRLNEEVAALFLRGTQGDLAVLPRHAPFVTTVRPGTVRVEREDGSEKRGQCRGGILSVRADGVSLLSSGFDWDEQPG